MFARRQLNLAKASLLLHTLKQDPGRLDLLLPLQKFLVDRILATERTILWTKRSMSRRQANLRSGRLPKVESSNLKSQIKGQKNYIRDLHQLLFIWKCYGDGVASVYQSSYSLKHLFYDHQYAVKQGPGFITGKTGFDWEWKALVAALEAGVPAVLSDITNTIRTGDICLLAGADPYPIEIKSSTAPGKRRSRQEETIEGLLSFFANDYAKCFRGSPSVRRVAVEVPEVRYELEMNACLESALKDGFSIVRPEPGLIYIGCRTALDMMDKVNPYLNNTTLLRMLTPEESWLPCHPFTLSLSPGLCYFFISSKVTIFVLIDFLHLKSLFAKHGVTAIILMDGTSAIQEIGRAHV